MRKPFAVLAVLAAAVIGALSVQAVGKDDAETAEPSATAISEPSAAATNEKPSATPSPAPTPAETPKPSASPTPKPQPKPPVSHPQAALPAWAEDSLPGSTIARVSGKAVITNSSSLYALVNKRRNLPSGYAPKDLVQPAVPFSFEGSSPKKKLRKSAASALEKLFAAAKQAGIELKGVSGYRSYATQKALFDSNARKKGAAEANRTSAHPGQSEHQTGLAIDVSSASVGYALEESFGKTAEGKWLAAHAHEYGFIIRYPKGKEKITGYKYEPWHIRYIGKLAAKDVFASGKTLEQYFDGLEASVAK